MTLVSDQPQTRARLRVSIDRTRAPLLADFFQKLDRMMTGLPVKVIIKDIASGALSSTDGKRIWMDWKVLTGLYSNETRLGLNSKELAHCFFGNTNYDRKVKGTLSHAANILLACRDLTLFCETYPSNLTYFIAYAQEVLIQDRDLADCGDVWPMLYGLKFLPVEVRLNSAVKHDITWVNQVTALIDEFITLPRDNKNIKRAVELTEEFSELLSGQTIYNPGGGTLLKSMSTFKGSSYSTFVRNIRLIVNRDKTALLRRVRISRTSLVASPSSKGGGGALQTQVGERRSEKYNDEEKIVTRNKRVSTKYTFIPSEVDALTEVFKTKGYVPMSTNASRLSKNIATLGNTTPYEDLGKDTDHSGDGGSGGGSGGHGSASSDGGNFSQVVMSEDGVDTQFVDDYTWVNTSGYDMKSLDALATTVTTDSVKDILKSMQDEVMFDDPLIDHAGWGGCGFVTADLRKFRHELDEELKLTAKTIRSRHARGKRGPIHIQAAMKAESGNPTADIFRIKQNYTSRTELQAEIVLLLDASGSMHSVINNVMKTQWLIGSAFEKLGANVTVIPFNNKARDPLKGRLDSYSEHVYPYCEASGGTQPQGALSVAIDIFKKAGRKHKVLFMLTDGCWNNAEWSHKLIDQLNQDGVQTVLVFMGGDRRDSAQIELSQYHHCKVGTKINNVDELLPEMRRVFFKEFKRAIKKSLKLYH